MGIEIAPNSTDVPVLSGASCGFLSIGDAYNSAPQQISRIYGSVIGCSPHLFFAYVMSDNHSLRVYDSMLGLLSGVDNPTPLVRLNKVTPFEHTQVYAKLEWYNPFGAVKDRVAANLIRDAEAAGVLQPGTKLVEATSGNTGVGLIMMGNLMGYPLRTPLSDQIPVRETHDAAIFWCRR